MQILSLNTRGYDTQSKMPNLLIDNFEKISCSGIEWNCCFTLSSFLKKVLFLAIQKMASEMLFLVCLLYASAEKLRPYKSNKRNGTFSCEEGKYLYCIARQIEVIDQKVEEMLENQEKIDQKRKKMKHSWKKKSSSCSSFCFPTSSNNTSLHCNFP